MDCYCFATFCVVYATYKGLGSPKAPIRKILMLLEHLSHCVDAHVGVMNSYSTAKLIACFNLLMSIEVIRF